MSEVKYPNITVKLTGRDGNAFSIIGRVGNALRAAGISEDEREKFREEAMSGDYDNVLTTCMKWVNVT
jgi:hypothetical protein